MKNLLTFYCTICFALTASAQLDNGTIAPNFTATDIDGNTHTLYEYLDSGYTVILDFSAVWCGPCWNYHADGILEEIWADHGPSGESGVNANTTNDVIVLWIEGDPNTDESLISGGGNSQGDWTDGTEYPLINDDNLAATYGISYWPTIYTICPTRKLTQSGSISSESHYEIVSDCPVAVSGKNASLTSYLGDITICGEEVNVKAEIQNLGTENLTAFNVKVLSGTIELASEDYNGSPLETYATTEIDFGGIEINEATTLEIKITNTDALADDNTLNQEIGLAKTAYQNLRVEVSVDNFGEDVSWKIKNESGTEISSGGPYNNSSNTQSLEIQPQDPKTVQIDPDGCYTFEVTDSYGDGMYGDEQTFFKVFDSNDLEIVAVYGNSFKSEISKKFIHTGGSVDIAKDLKLSEVSICSPNPFYRKTNLFLNVIKPEVIKLSATNILGESVLNKTLVLNVGEHTIPIDLEDFKSGIYSVNLESKSFKTSHKVIKIN